MAGENEAHASDAVVLPLDEHQRLLEEAARAAEFKDLFQRTRADFLNYQDRAAAERTQAAERAVAEVVRQFLPILDALRDSLAALEKKPEPAAVLEGLRLLEREIHRILATNEVYRIEALGEPFDPARHEAVGTVETDGAQEGTAVEEVRPGYRRKDRVLRPAMIRVARRRKEEADGEGGKGAAPGGAGAGAGAGGGPPEGGAA